MKMILRLSLFLLLFNALVPLVNAQNQTYKSQLKLNGTKDIILDVESDLVKNEYLLIINRNAEEECLKFINSRIDSIWMFQIINDKPVEFYTQFGLKQQSKKHINYIIPLPIKTGIDTFRLILKSSYKMKLQAVLEPTEIAIKKEHNYEMWFSLYTGVMLVMVIYNLFLFFSTRDKIYFLYVGFILFVMLTQLSIFGFTAKYLWPNNAWMNYQSVNICTALVGIASLEFFRKFNKVKKFYSKLYPVLNIFHFVYIIAIAISISSIYNAPLGYAIISINASLLSTVAMIITVPIMRKGYRPAKFFLLAWSIFIVGVILYILKDFGLIGVTFITKYTMPIGSALETVILSLALADRINTLKKEKEESQAQALLEMRKNQQLIKEQNIILEQKVNERTAELELTLSNLKAAQAQLIDAEKMASLGQLTAGIAHEINNPINFVSSNIEPLKADIKDVIDILIQYKEKVKSLNTSDFKSISEYEEEIDLDYTIKEIDQLMKGIKEGASRTTEIVNSLRSFSRTDESTISTIDVHDTIDATITILKNNLGKIKIIKDYGNLPPIEAYAGKLSQAFMNVINNALQAVEDIWKANEGGQLIIKTALLNDSVSIKIIDNGPGISSEIVSKIFDPFFTTKEVGSGTGLGLSITYGIIEHHKGKIFVESQENKGTTMVIELPIKQK
jgi:two-component system NtrC family sensor kinase